MLLAALLAISGIAHAEPTHDVVPEDAFTLDGVGSIAVDRRGYRAVFVRSRWDTEADERQSDLWTVDRKGRTERLTFLESRVRSPSLTADDQHVFFLAPDDDGATQVFRVSTDGGADPQQLTETEDGVDQYVLDRDSDTLWFSTTTTEHGDDAFEHLRDRFDRLDYAARTHARTTVHALDLETWRLDTAWAPDAYLIDFDVTDDGDRFAGVTAPDSALITHEGWSEARIHTPATGETLTLDDTLWRGDGVRSPYGWMADIAWADDGRALAFRVDWDGYPGETFIAELAGDEPPLLWTMPRPGGVTPIGAPVWVPDSRELCVRVADHARQRIVCASRVRSGDVGRLRAFPNGDVVVDAWGMSGDGRDIYAAVGTAQRFPDIYRLPARGNLFPRQLTDLNPHVDDWKLPRVSLVSWTAPDGTEVSGVLETPAGWERGDGPLPTVVHLHGGPTWHTAYARRFGYQGRTAFAAAGYALFSPNYRGSLGYGDTFLVELVGRENDMDVADIHSGIDKLVELGIADPDRLGVGGWSNGGFLTNALITGSDRFRAASSGAGVSDQLVQWALEDTPGHVINYMEGLPWDRAEAYAAASPLRMADAVSTPTLFHVGEFDARVPAAHAKGMFRALEVYLDVPTELVVYPDTGHGLWRRSDRLAKLTWDLAWYETYLTAPEAPEADDAAPPADEAADDEGASAPDDVKADAPSE